MKKSELRNLMIVETRNKKRWLVVDDKLIGIEIGYNLLEDYNDDLLVKDRKQKQYDIMVVYKSEMWGLGIKGFIDDEELYIDIVWKREERPKLSINEKVILRELSKEYKYIARDDSENKSLAIYKEKPYKGNWVWCTDNGMSTYDYFNGFNHLFKFIKWEDEEPYLISDLLEE